MISNELFCQTMRQTVSEVTVITTEHDGQLHAMTATSFTSVSAEPPLALVCIKRGNDTDELVAKSGRIGVSLLSENQQKISSRYAWKGPERDRFDDLDTHRCPGGALVFDNCVAAMEAIIVESYEAGDHTIYIVQLDYAAVDSESRPLLYWKGDYAKLEASAASAQAQAAASRSAS